MPGMMQPAQILDKHPPTGTRLRVLQHFRWTHQGLDVAPILAELDGQPDLWDQHPERHLAPGSLLPLRIGSGGLVPRPVAVDAAAGRSRGVAWQPEHQPVTA